MEQKHRLPKKKRGDCQKPNEDYLRAMPKGDLHRHLGGSMSFERFDHEVRRQGLESEIVRIAGENGFQMDAYDKDKLHTIICDPGQFETLGPYLTRFKLTERVLMDRQALRETSEEIARSAVENEGVRYLELRFSPTNYICDGLWSKKIIEAVVEGLCSAEDPFKHEKMEPDWRGYKRHVVKYGFRTGLIISGMKCSMVDPETIADPIERQKIKQAQFNLRETVDIATVAKKYYQEHHFPIGFDLCGAEDFPLKAFKHYLYKIDDAKMQRTIHAGESANHAAISAAIYDLSANRIGHGTKLYFHQSLLDYIVANSIALEVCLSSNAHTNTTTRRSVTPAGMYLDAGAKVVPCTDNTTMDNTDLIQEYMHFANIFELNRYQCKLLAWNSLWGGFLHIKDKLPFISDCIDMMDQM